ncbi:MAG TPA: dihydrolipoamide acetyltransferase family protein [Streptosporangiaceae bacterium]|jgi:pyruvate dehydrogenase E2 component (dihydrolipoamide acetyltransferase)|nr:dihydrolipoamide acetyltransferase family protein [Streptosporangiaceae bacterium]
MPEVKQFKLPDVGEGLTEADIVAWHVKPGDSVSVNQIIVEIETAKAVVELPSPYEGVVTGLLAEVGQTVDVGTPIIAVDVGGEDGGGTGPATTDVPARSTPAGTSAVAEPEGAAAGASAGGGDAADVAARGTGADGLRDEALADDLVPRPPAEGAVEPGVEGSPAPKVERQAVLVGYGVKLGATKRRQRKGAGARGRSDAGAAAGAAAPGAAAAQPSPAPVATAEPSAAPGQRAADADGDARPVAKPPVRKMAKDLGVDLAGVVGTGPDGTITREDVQAAVAGGAAPEPVVQIAGAREERIAVRGVRKHTAAAVTGSAFTAPHVTEFLQVDVTETMETVRRLRDLPEFAELRPSPLLLVAKALLLAVARHPMINSSWDEAANEIVVKHYVNLGIAAATDRGLIVPNVKDAHTLSLAGLARALAELAVAAREGKSRPADLAGGTITITNVGVFGVDAGTPILTPGEAAILAFGQVREMPWVHEGELAVRRVTTLSLSFDHRIVDGDLGSAVLRDVGEMLTDPVRMLAWC